MITLRKAREISRKHGFSGLITEPAGNAKLQKSVGYYNCGISLAQHKMSGHNVCPAATKSCIASCLGDTGRAEFTPLIKQIRINRTKLYSSDPKTFWEVLEPQLHMIDRKAENLGLPVAFRPNILSDQPWHSKFPQMFEDFPHWQFYGYTKMRSYARQYVEGKLPQNYHLTFSWSERLDTLDAKSLIADGLNVAVPFYDKRTLRGRIPRRQWRGLRVINGDESDLRFLDPSGVIVGLSTKLPKNRKRAADVIREADGFFVGLSR